MKESLIASTGSLGKSAEEEDMVAVLSLVVAEISVEVYINSVECRFYKCYITPEKYCISIVLRSPRCLSVLSSLLQLVHINVLLRVLGALQSVVGRTYRVEAAPVSFAQNPWKNVHLVMELRRELGADEVRRSGTFAPGDQLHVLVVAAVLCCQRGAVERQHGAYTEPGRRLVDIEALFGSAGVAPPVGLAQLLVEDVHSAVDDLGRVDAGAAG